MYEIYILGLVVILFVVSLGIILFQTKTINYQKEELAFDGDLFNAYNEQIEALREVIMHGKNIEKLQDAMIKDHKIIISNLKIIIEEKETVISSLKTINQIH